MHLELTPKGLRAHAAAEVTSSVQAWTIWNILPAEWT